MRTSNSVLPESILSKYRSSPRSGMMCDPLHWHHSKHYIAREHGRGVVAPPRGNDPWHHQLCSEVRPRQQWRLHHRPRHRQVMITITSSFCQESGILTWHCISLTADLVSAATVRWRAHHTPVMRIWAAWPRVRGRPRGRDTLATHHLVTGVTVPALRPPSCLPHL